MDQMQFEECQKSCLKTHQSIKKSDLVDLLIEAGESIESDRPDLEKDTKLAEGLRIKLCNWLCHGEFDKTKNEENAARLKRIKAKIQILVGKQAG